MPTITPETVDLRVEQDGDTINLVDVHTGRKLGAVISQEIHESVGEPRTATVKVHLHRKDGDIASIWD